MTLITKQRVLEGVYLVEIPEQNLKILCGCPADSIKHLAIKNLLPITEKNGIQFESGPNAILLSDILVQNGALSNLSEFPVLHMFYNQGMILPDHPNYAQKPLLIGKKSQVLSQMDYIFLGNYGLVSEEEFIDAGETLEFAKQDIRMKRRFALGRFIPSNELMEGVYLDNDTAEIRPGVTIERKKQNIFLINYKEKSVTVDLNLKKNQKYSGTYSLPKIKIPNHYFAIIHSGEGDGWDPNRPCLSSIIKYNNKIYLIDAGPNLLITLAAFGIKPNRIEGIFFTHIHDDHFAGLHSLFSDKHKIRIYATNVVRSTIYKKLCALLSQSEEELSKHITFTDLKKDEWNNLDGMEIQPIPSAHPIDTTIFLFRVKTKNGYRSYGHYSDIAALSWLKKMVINKNKTDDCGISENYLKLVRKIFDIKVNVKKIDVGGPAVHGDVEDFANDLSDRLVMGHTHCPFTPRQLEIGDEVKFGEIDVLIDKKSDL